MSSCSRIAIVAVCTALLAGCTSSGDGNALGKRARAAADARAAQAREAAARAGLSPAVQDLVATAAGVAGHEFSVTYDLGQPGRTAAIVQEPPFRRVEVHDDSGVQLAVDNASGSFSCRQPRNAPAACQQDSGSATPPGGFSLDQVAATSDALASARESYTFTVDHRTVAGTRASCLVATLKPGADLAPGSANHSTLCVATTGAPLLIDTGGPVVQATRYSTSADRKAFTLPAPAARTG